MNINLIPKEIFKINMYLILFLLCANIIGVVSKFYFGHDTVYGLVDLFNFDIEKNIPTLYSSIALIVASILLLSIAFINQKHKSSYIPWLGLSLIFLFLSIDEISSIHEELISPTREALKTAGVFYFAWIIPYGIALVVFITAYSKFLFKLPKNIMILFVVSGAIFVCGAIVFEMIGGRHYEIYGKDNILYALIYTCEESLEMIGIAVFIYTLLTYIVNEFESIIITIDKRNE